MNQNKTHRLTKVAKEFNVGVSSLIDFFTQNGVEGLKPNSKIDDETYKLALNKYGDEKLIKEKIKEQREREAQLKKTTVTLDDIDHEEQAEVDNADEPNAEIFVQQNVVEEEDKKESETKKEKPESDAKENIGPKILGKMDLNAVSGKREKPKSEKNKEEKEDEKKIKKEDRQEPKKEEKKNKKSSKSKKDVKENDVTAEKVEEKTNKEKDTKEKQSKEATEKEKVEKKEEVVKKEEVKVEKETKKEVKNEKKSKDDNKKQEAKENLTTENNKNVDKKDVKAKEQKNTGKKKKDDNKLKGPKILGKLDLENMNLKTRPDKKTAAEKEEERKKKRQENSKKRRNQKDKTKKPFNKKNEKGENVKRSKGGKRVEKVEINKEGKIINKERQRIRNKKVNVQKDEKTIKKTIRDTLQKLEQNKQKDKAILFRKDKRNEHRKRAQEALQKQKAESNILRLSEFITIKEIATLMNVSPTKVIEVCMDLGQPVTINYRLDSEMINLITEFFNFKVEYVQSSIEEEIEKILNSDENKVTPRPPIVTVMGHVDHGKTSLLDYIRKTNVVSGESGGITQHIGAYNVRVGKDKEITFIDTPGHEAFTTMRARGTKVTDIAVIIIAADDSIMSQTDEAIDHARAADVPMIFAINKIDKPGADPERIKQQLAERNLLVEDWGGKYGSVEISAKNGINIDELLERIAFEAEILELRADPNRRAIATVFEAELDKGRGFVTNVIVRTGTLKVGDVVVSGGYYGKVKALFNEFQKRIKKVGPSHAVQILGLNGAPEPGEPLYVTKTDKEAREKAEQRLQIMREMEFRTRKQHSLSEISRRLSEGEKLELNIIVKADVKGSIDAITAQLTKLSNDEVNVNVIRGGVGQISESDVTLAEASTTIIIGFNVRPSLEARKLAESSGIEIRLYSVIFNVIDDIKDAVQGMLAPEMKEEIIGSAEVLKPYKVSKVGTIAGCVVRDGKITNDCNIRLIRDGIVVYTAKIKSLKRLKNDATEVLKGFECGIGIENFNDIKQGDFIEAFKEFSVAKKI